MLDESSECLKSFPPTSQRRLCQSSSDSSVADRKLDQVLTEKGRCADHLLDTTFFSGLRIRAPKEGGGRDMAGGRQPDLVTARHKSAPLATKPPIAANKHRDLPAQASPGFLTIYPTRAVDGTETSPAQTACPTRAVDGSETSPAQTAYPTRAIYGTETSPAQTACSTRAVDGTETSPAQTACPTRAIYGTETSPAQTACSTRAVDGSETSPAQTAYPTRAIDGTETSPAQTAWSTRAVDGTETSSAQTAYLIRALDGTETNPALTAYLTGAVDGTETSPAQAAHPVSAFSSEGPPAELELQPFEGLVSAEGVQQLLWSMGSGSHRQSMRSSSESVLPNDEDHRQTVARTSSSAERQVLQEMSKPGTSCPLLKPSHKSQTSPCRFRPSKRFTKASSATNPPRDITVLDLSKGKHAGTARKTSLTDSSQTQHRSGKSHSGTTPPRPSKKLLSLTETSKASAGIAFKTGRETGASGKKIYIGQTSPEKITKRKRQSTCCKASRTSPRKEFHAESDMCALPRASIGYENLCPVINEQTTAKAGQKDKVKRPSKNYVKKKSSSDIGEMCKQRIKTTHSFFSRCTDIKTLSARANNVLCHEQKDGHKNEFEMAHKVFSIHRDSSCSGITRVRKETFFMVQTQKEKLAKKVKKSSKIKKTPRLSTSPDVTKKGTKRKTIADGQILVPFSEPQTSNKSRSTVAKPRISDQTSLVLAKLSSTLTSRQPLAPTTKQALSLAAKEPSSHLAKRSSSSSATKPTKTARRQQSSETPSRLLHPIPRRQTKLAAAHSSSSAAKEQVKLNASTQTLPSETTQRAAQVKPRVSRSFAKTASRTSRSAAKPEVPLVNNQSPPILASGEQELPKASARKRKRSNKNKLSPKPLRPLTPRSKSPEKLRKAKNGKTASHEKLRNAAIRSNDTSISQKETESTKKNFTKKTSGSDIRVKKKQTSVANISVDAERVEVISRVNLSSVNRALERPPPGHKNRLVRELAPDSDQAPTSSKLTLDTSRATLSDRQSCSITERSQFFPSTDQSRPMYRATLGSFTSASSKFSSRSKSSSGRVSNLFTTPKTGNKVTKRNIDKLPVVSPCKRKTTPTSQPRQPRLKKEVKGRRQKSTKIEKVVHMKRSVSRGCYLTLIPPSLDGLQCRNKSAPSSFPTLVASIPSPLHGGSFTLAVTSTPVDLSTLDPLDDQATLYAGSRSQMSCSVFGIPSDSQAATGATSSFCRASLGGPSIASVVTFSKSEAKLDRQLRQQTVTLTPNRSPEHVRPTRSTDQQTVTLTPNSSPEHEHTSRSPDQQRGHTILKQSPRRTNDSQGTWSSFRPDSQTLSSGDQSSSRPDKQLHSSKDRLSSRPDSHLHSDTRKPLDISRQTRPGSLHPRLIQPCRNVPLRADCTPRHWNVPLRADCTPRHWNVPLAQCARSSSHQEQSRQASLEDTRAKRGQNYNSRLYQIIVFIIILVIVSWLVVQLRLLYWYISR